jgi:hypothetical protein
MEAGDIPSEKNMNDLSIVAEYGEVNEEKRRKRCDKKAPNS